MINPIQKNIKTLMPFFIMLGGILAVSSSSILIRLLQKDVPSLTIAFYRLFISSLFLLPLALRKYKTEISKLNRNDFLFLFLSGAFLAMHFATWITSLEYTSVISSVVLVTTSPIWVTLFTFLRSRENIKKSLLVGLLLVLSGSLTVSFSQYQFSGMGVGEGGKSLLFQMFGGTNLIGNLLALLGAFCAAGYLLVGKKMRSSVGIIPYSLLVYGMGALILLIFVIVFRRPVIGFSIQDFVLLIALAILPQLIGHSIFNWALAYMSVTFVSVAFLGEPIGTTILALIILKEYPTWLEICGGIIILTGLFFASRTEKVEKEVVGL